MEPQATASSTRGEMQRQLDRWARHACGADAVVSGLDQMPGHSGITFGFDVEHAGARGGRERLVVRIPPKGVRRQGVTDVLRQVPLLQLMARAGVTVPAVRWWGADERWFGVPYLIVDRVPGRTISDVFDPASGTSLGPADAEPLFGQAMTALVAIHRADWRTGLAGWDEPRSLADEVERYLPLMERSPDTGWRRRGAVLAERLSASAPPDPEPGVVHGDFYSNNWMFDGGRLTAVLDWEGTFIGPRSLDLGWLVMMYDREGWEPAHRDRIGFAPPPEVLLDQYAAATGDVPADVQWYRALAGYKLACLSAYYLRLHLAGKRHDPVWEELGASVPYLLGRAASVLDEGL